MKNAPYIKLARRFFDHDLWKKKREFSMAEAWLYLIQRARWKKGEGTVIINEKFIKINRGEMVASLRFLCAAWNWRSPNKVSRFLKYLENEQMIGRKTKQGETILTLCNYDNYNFMETAGDTATEQRRNSDGTATEQRRKKGKERIKKEKEGESAAAGDFELTKRIGRPAARMWTEGQVANVLNGKSDVALDWLAYRCETGKPLSSHAEMVVLINTFQKFDKKRLLEMMEYSVAAGYPALYPDFDQNKKGGTGEFPKKWSRAAESKLQGADLVRWYRQLRESGQVPVKARMGQVIKYVPITEELNRSIYKELKNKKGQRIGWSS